jgi:hypothetical protein
MSVGVMKDYKLKLFTRLTYTGLVDHVKADGKVESVYLQLYKKRRRPRV